MIQIIGDWAPGLKQIEYSLGEDFVISNLEGPILTENHSLIAASKAGPRLFSTFLPENSSNLIFTMANNHIFDFGLLGFEQTTKKLKQRKIRFCGAGISIHEARLPLIIQDGGKTIGIIACCEAQFGVARYNMPGVAEFGSWIYKAIKDLCEKVDIVIISVHAGIEDSPWPSPYIRDLYHSFVDAGATIVHGHHSHISQGFEKYRDGVIFYGLGNFAVDPDKWKDSPNALWSLGAKIDINTNPITWKLVTYKINPDSHLDKILIEESSTEDIREHLKYLEKCNHPLMDEKLFQSLWQEVSLRAFFSHGARYINFKYKTTISLSRILRDVFFCLKSGNITKNAEILQDKKSFQLYYHMVACESHRQMLITALGFLSGEIPDLRNSESQSLADEMMPWTRGIVPL